MERYHEVFLQFKTMRFRSFELCCNIALRCIKLYMVKYTLFHKQRFFQLWLSVAYEHSKYKMYLGMMQ